MLPAELHHRRRAFDTGASLHRARFVVNARMNDAAIVSALMRANLGFLLEHHHPHPWKLPRSLPRHRQPHHPATDHHDVISIVHCAPFDRTLILGARTPARKIRAGCPMFRVLCETWDSTNLSLLGLANDQPTTTTPPPAPPSCSASSCPQSP